MKELSIEERAQRYDEALDRAKKWYNAPNIDKMPTYGNRIIEEIFPELKKPEDEDEKIRKGLIENFKWFCGDFPETTKWGKDDNLLVKDIIAWLEKQKTSEEAIQYLKENHSPSEVSDFQAAMNIAVAKAYDKGVKDGLKKQGWHKPACSEEDEKKELKKISQRMISAEAKEAMYGKPTAWSEEDEKMLNYIIYDIESLKEQIYCKTLCDEEIDWLKSLKDKYTWKPSDEQMDALEQFISEYKDIDDNSRAYPITHNIESLYNDLKKLKE